MAVLARLKFAQGFTVGNPGQALFGNTGAPVTASNGSTLGIANYTFEMLDVPADSGVPTGLVQDGGATSFVFTPDVRGAYLLRLTVKDAAGNASVDVRAFGVKERSGRFIPAFKGKGSAFNFAGQLRGWAVYLERWLRYVDGQATILTSGAGPLNDVVTVGPNGDAGTSVTFIGGPTVTGFGSPFEGRRLYVVADGAAVILANNNAGSASDNRITTGTGASMTVPDGSAACLLYNRFKWRVVRSA